MTVHRSALGLLAGLVLLAACSNAKIDNMVAGGNVGNGKLECWLELVFDQYPEGVDARDVRVRFSGEALDQAAEFDWDWIAARDVVQGTRFGDGNPANEATRPSEPPPLGEVIKVRFPLRAKPELVTLDEEIWLEAELYWGDARQDSSKRDIQRLYAAKGSKTPWSM